MNSLRNKVSRYLPAALRLALGVMFLYAAWTKLRQSWLLFAMAVDAYGLLPQWAVTVVARALPWAELLLGVWLITGKWIRLSASAASLVMLAFLTMMVRSYFKGMQIDCGCFGGGDVISPYTLLRDGSLLGASLALTWFAFRRAGRTSLPGIERR
jgi:putative oxidoreductase